MVERLAMGKRDRERRQRIQAGKEAPFLQQELIDARLKKFGLFEEFTGTLNKDGVIILRYKGGGHRCLST